VSRFRAALAAELVVSLRCLRMQGARPAVLRDELDHRDAQHGGTSGMHDRDLTSDLLLAEELVETLPDHVPPVQRDARRRPTPRAYRGR
jgi:histidine ammonia-lyase